jgi:hypothetical protein
VIVDWLATARAVTCPRTVAGAVTSSINNPKSLVNNESSIKDHLIEN